MAWRKWIVRGVVYGISGACVLAALLYERWTNPTAVREQIIAKLSETFPGAQISVDSARLRILGGIQLNGLRLTRKDDPEKQEFLHVPSAIFYHDKEKILDGELTLRKIELHNPRLRVRKQPDGKWNVQGLVREPEKPQTTLPAIVIHQGTLIVEDRSDPTKTASLEINDISLTVINDPLPTVTIRGAANSDWLGKLQLHGQLNRDEQEADIVFKASQIPLTQALVARFPSQCPSHLLAGLQLHATANVRGRVAYHPRQTPAVFYDIHCEVKDGNVQHPRLPLPLEDLQAKLHCSNGELHLETLTARSGKTELEAHGVGLLPNIDQEFEVYMDLKHVMLGDELAARLPEKMRNLHKMCLPNGPATIQMALARHEGEWMVLSSGKPSRISLCADGGVSFAFVGFPYPLHRARGSIDYDLLDKHVKVHALAEAAGRPVELHGDWIGEGAQAKVRFDVVSQDYLPIDDTLLQSIPANLRAFAGSFHATGKVKIDAFIRHEPGAARYQNEYHVNFRDTAIRWDNFPYPLQSVKGNLIIYPDSWLFDGFQGSHKGGQVFVRAESTLKQDDSHGISLKITGHDIDLDDDELRDALRPMSGLHNAWITFQPHGRLSFTATVNRPNNNVHDLEVDVDARGCSVRPTFFPYRIEDIAGKFRFHQRRLEVIKLRAKHDHAVIALDRANIDLNERGGYYADLRDLEIQGIRIDDEFVHALPRKLQDLANQVRLQDPLRVKTRLVVAQPPEQGKPPDVYWDSEVQMYQAKFTTGLEFSNVTGTLACIGRHNGRQIVGLQGNLWLDEATLYNQPFKNTHAKFQVRDTAPDMLLVGLRAPIFGGDVTGQLVFNFNSTLRYELNLTASQINTAEAGRHNLGPSSQLAGIASARLYLTGMGNSFETLDGNGSIDIPRGHFYNLPFLFDLLKFLGLHWPDRTAFEEFHLAYAVQGSRVSVQKLDLLGSALSLSGKGEYDLQSKNMQLDIYPMWGRIEQILPAAVRPFPTTVSKNLLTVEVRGKVDAKGKNLKYHMKPMPVIVDPLLLLRDRMTGQTPGQNNNLGIGLSLPIRETPPEPQRPRWFRFGLGD